MVDRLRAIRRQSFLMVEAFNIVFLNLEDPSSTTLEDPSSTTLEDPSSTTLAVPSFSTVQEALVFTDLASYSVTPFLVIVSPSRVTVP